MTSNTPPSLSKLQGFFGKKDNAAAPTIGAMTPEKYRQLLERTLALSPTGNGLLRFAAQQQVLIHVIPGKGAAGYIPDQRAVFITLPAGLSTVSVEDALSLGAYLRHAELQLAGYKNPDESMTLQQQATNFDTKILDSLVIMCQIAREVNDSGNTEFVDALARMGHSEFYKGFVKYGRGQDLTNLYYEEYIK